MTTGSRKGALTRADLAGNRTRLLASGLGAYVIVLSLAMPQESLSPFTRAMGLCIAFIVVAAISVWTAWTGGRLTLTPLAIPIAALVLYEFALLPRSPLPGYAINHVAMIAGGFLVFVVVQVSLQRGWPAETWENALLSVGVVLSILAAVVVVL